MLSRTADHVYWLGRYAERAEGDGRERGGPGDGALDRVPGAEHDHEIPRERREHVLGERGDEQDRRRELAGRRDGFREGVDETLG